ncbi:MAG: hypothetical protein VX737_00775 [Pseudomonadota bacterium]|nr:hypothetical protein [Pseudomonadota bacterium]
MKLKSISKITLVLIIFFSHFQVQAINTKPVDIVIFSYDRPIQLYALLESIEQNITPKDSYNLHILVRASNEDFIKGYQLVSHRFPSAKYFYESNNAIQGKLPKFINNLNLISMPLEKLFYDATFNTSISQSPYVIFAVDDIIVTDRINLKKDIETFEKQQAYTLSYRLGLNIKETWTINKVTTIPEFDKIQSNMIQWNFDQDKEGDWNYPNSFDFHLYRKSDIVMNLKMPKSRWRNPNTMESTWANRTIANTRAIAHRKSKIINIPANDVSENAMRSIQGLDTGTLLKIFLAGYKIKSEQFQGHTSKAAHEEIKYTFIERT